MKKKKWTEYELNGLFSKEKNGQKVILPIWHDITKDDISQYSLTFADRIAKRSDDIPSIVKEFKNLFNMTWQTKKLSEVCDVFADGDWIEKKINHRKEYDLFKRAMLAMVFLRKGEKRHVIFLKRHLSDCVALKFCRLIA